jgi:hypothetical protein
MHALNTIIEAHYIDIRGIQVEHWTILQAGKEGYPQDFIHALLTAQPDTDLYPPLLPGDKAHEVPVFFRVTSEVSNDFNLKKVVYTDEHAPTDESEEIITCYG